MRAGFVHTASWTLAAAVAAAAPAPAIRYHVYAANDLRTLVVEMHGPASLGSLTLDDDLVPFVSDVFAKVGRGWLPVERTGDVFRMPTGASGHVWYSFDLAAALARVRDRYRMQAHGDAIVTRPSAWLLRPVKPGKGRYRLEVSTPPGLRFVSGLGRPEGDLDGADAYEADVAYLSIQPYSAFGAFEIDRLSVPGGTVDVAVAPGDFQVDQADILRWVEESARDAAATCGTLAVPRVQVLVVSGGRRGIGLGTTMGYGGASILVRLGAAATVKDLASDWVLPHEMAHLGFPNVHRRHSWLEEGLATYLEPICRARRGRITEQEAWSGLRKGMGQGLPGPGDQGLDTTHTWGRTYWGGALFCLAADVAFRERTGNRHGLEEALCGIRAEGGDIRTFWPIERVIAAGDRAAGVGVLRETYESMALRTPPPLDLPGLWARLGVVEKDGVVVLDDSAPLAAVRRAIVAGRTKATDLNAPGSMR